MRAKSIVFGVLLFATTYLATAQYYPLTETATVRVKLYSAIADDLGVGTITEFRRLETDKDYFQGFRNNIAPDIPYGVYDLRVYREGFQSGYRRVLVYGPDVWVVLGLEIGRIDFLNYQPFSGVIRNLPRTDGPIWARLAGVRVPDIHDARVDASGKFSFPAVLPDTYSLTVWAWSKTPGESRILHTSAIDTIKSQSVTIDLLKVPTSPHACPDCLTKFLQGFVKIPPLPEDRSTRYIDAHVDLNGDKKPEVIVYLAGPDWCGSGGCTVLILTQDPAFKVLTKLTVTRPPIRFLTNKTNGWNDLGVHVAGGGILEGYEAILQFDGKTYPANPTVAPARPAHGKPKGKVVIAPQLKGLKPLFP